VQRFRPVIELNSVPTFLTAPIEPGSISTLVRASGTVEAVIRVVVSSQLSGRVAEVFVSFNDPIKAGQPIAQLDQEIFAAHVNEGKAALSVARATAQVQKAALERARVAVVNAQTTKETCESAICRGHGQACRARCLQRWYVPERGTRYGTHRYGACR
jgi:HlyD family secretion protein